MPEWHLKRRAIWLNKLKQKDKIIGMCGDGANDWKALKTADIGISLSIAEASIAAPFTSITPNISSVVILLKEGKASLATIFQLFKMIFSFSIIQTTGVFTMYNHNNDFTDMQFLFIDLLIIFPLCFFMPLTKSAKKLTQYVPINSLLSAPIIVSIGGQCSIWMIWQFIVLYILKQQDFYIPIVKDAISDVDVSYENTILFTFSNIQYFSIVFAFNIAKPFIAPIYTNILLSISITLSMFLWYYIIVEPSTIVMDIIDLAYLPKEFRYELALATVLNFLAWYLFEKIISQLFSDYWEQKSIQGKQKYY